MDTIIESAVCEINKVSASNRHKLRVELRLEGPHARLERGNSGHLFGFSFLNGARVRSATTLSTQIRDDNN
jgi:hypothetical protein